MCFVMYRLYCSNCTASYDGCIQYCRHVTEKVCDIVSSPFLLFSFHSLPLLRSPVQRARDVDWLFVEIVFQRTVKIPTILKPSVISCPRCRIRNNITRCLKDMLRLRPITQHACQSLSCQRHCTYLSCSNTSSFRTP